MDLKTKDKTWKDEQGQSVPVQYISQGDRLKERTASRLLKEAESLNKRLRAFKELVIEKCDEVWLKMMAEYKVNPDRKGNFTFYDFEHKIKIEVDIQEGIDFDDMLIQACKTKLDEFLDDNVESKDDFIKEMVTDAFNTSRGKLDVRKVMNLMKWEEKVKKPLFQEAISLLKQSIRRPDSKRYFRIWKKDAENAWEIVNLNFSSI